MIREQQLVRRVRCGDVFVVEDAQGATVVEVRIVQDDRRRLAVAVTSVTGGFIGYQPRPGLESVAPHGP